jgi:hypothetical protein
MKVCVDTQIWPGSTCHDFTYVSTTSGTISPVWAGSTTSGLTYGITSHHRFDVVSNSISLGGTYYELYADGTTGPPVTSITLRTGEGKIMLEYPIN